MASTQSDADPRNRPDAAGRKFNGRVFTFADGDQVTEVTKVQVKYNENAFSSTTLINGIDYVFSNNKIELQGAFAFRIFVDFELDITPEQAIASGVPKEFVDLQLEIINAVEPSVKGTTESLKGQNIALNGSPFNNPGEVINNMKGMFAGGKPIKDSVQKLRPVQMLQGAGDGSADDTITTSELNDFNSLTKFASTVKTKLNKKVFTQGTSSGSLRIFKKHLTANKQKIKEFAAATKSSTLSTKVTNQLKTAIDNEDNGVTPSANAVKTVAAEIKKKLPDINNAGLSLGGLANKLLPAGGRSGMNALANMISTKRNGVVDKLGDVVKKRLGTPEGLKIPEGVEVPNLIEGINEKTGEISFDTNFSKLVEKGNLISKNTQPINVVNLESSASGFSGFTTSQSYVFETVDSPDELEQEFVNSERYKTQNPTAITTLVVGWTSKYAGPPPPVGNFDARFIHEKSKKADIAFLVNELSGPGGDPTEIANTANNTIKKNPRKFGIQSHYIIRTDGTVQRGRPIDETRNKDYSTFSESGIQLTLVATKEKPATQFQINALENFLMVFYEVFPGGNVYGDYEINRRYEGPGFDLEIYRNKFQKTTNIDDPTTVTEGPSKKESAIKRPNVIAKSSQTAFNANRKFSFDAMLKDFEKINELDGEKITTDIETAQSEIDKALSDTDAINNDINDNFNAAKAKAAGSFAKLQSDANIKGLKIEKDALSGKIDNLIKDAAPSTSVGANKLASGINAFKKFIGTR
tara:strand:+ start:2050 stop:4305 length:2256 start_codon:yes stop_codon:yes gene_type:complete